MRWLPVFVACALFGFGCASSDGSTVFADAGDAGAGDSRRDAPVTWRCVLFDDAGPPSAPFYDDCCEVPDPDGACGSLAAGAVAVTCPANKRGAAVGSGCVVGIGAADGLMCCFSGVPFVTVAE